MQKSSYVCSSELLRSYTIIISHLSLILPHGSSPSTHLQTIDANNNEVTTPINTPIDIQVLDNDVPTADGSALFVIAILFSGNNGVCTISNNGETITYTPDVDYFGSDKCVYTACDKKGHCDSATVVIIVIPSSDVLVANDDDVVTQINTPVDVFALENDVQVEGYPMTIVSIQDNADNGDCVIVNDGQVVMYIPNPDYNKVDSCIYMVCDDRGICDTAVITVTIEGNPCEETGEVPSGTPKPTS